MIARAECVECGQPATVFVEPGARHDPHCAACASVRFVDCGHCGTTVHADEVFEAQESRATRWSPAEYGERCVVCCPAPDPRARDEYEADRL